MLKQKRTPFFKFFTKTYSKEFIKGLFKKSHLFQTTRNRNINCNAKNHPLLRFKYFYLWKYNFAMLLIAEAYNNAYIYVVALCRAHTKNISDPSNQSIYFFSVWMLSISLDSFELTLFAKTNQLTKCFLYFYLYL